MPENTVLDNNVSSIIKKEAIPKLRLPNFHRKWNQLKLGEIADIYDGTHQTPNYVESGVKFVSVENIHDIYHTNKFISEEEFKKFKVKPQIGDILMTRITAGIIGDTAIVEKDEALGYYVSLALIRIKKESNIYFLNYYINSHQFKHELHKRIIHVAFPKKINLGDIGSCTVKIPELSEQEKIASFLTSVDNIISSQESRINTLETYNKGLISKIFKQEIRFKDDNGNQFPDWEEDIADDVCVIQTGSGNTQDKEDNGIYPFFVRSPIIEHSNKYIFDCEAVLTVGDGVGTGKVYHYMNGKFNCHQRVYAMTNFKNILGKYFYYYFKIFFPKRVYSMSAKTSVDSVRREMIANMKIFIPCLEEQKKISEFLSDMDRVLEQEKVYLEQLKAIKRGLLQQMFV